MSQPPAAGPKAGDLDSRSRRLNGTRLRLARLARRVSQAELAELAGVTRQAVAGVEAGRWDPSLRVALALARGLGVEVEELFGPPATHPLVDAEALVPVADAGVRVELAQVAGRQVALPLVADRTLRPGFGPASGVTASGVDPDRRDVPGSASRRSGRPVDSGRVAVRPNTAPARSVVVAGCDPALPLLAEPLARQNPPLSLAWWPCSTGRALQLAAAGLVHVAGVHLASGPGGAGDLQTLVGGPLQAMGAEVIGFARWYEGLVFQPQLGPELDLVGVAQRRLRLVNRDVGSEARALLEAGAAEADVRIDDLPGADSTVTAHLLVASAVASGLGQVGVCIEACALAYGLGFSPLAHEDSQLVLPTPLLGTVEVQGLLRALASSDLQAQLSQVPGYDAGPCGEAITTVAPTPA